MSPTAFPLRQGLLLLALLFVLLAPARAGEPLRLGGERSYEAWPFATLHVETGAPLNLAQALQAPFVRPDTPRANLGRRDHGVWLRVPLAADAADGHWVMHIDFAGIDHADAWLLRDGTVVDQAALGDHVPRAQRPADALAIAWPLQLQPGARYELMLRVESSAALVLPLRFTRPAEFNREQEDRLLVYGVLVGIGIALLVYAAMLWADTRDAMITWYAVCSASGLLFLLAFHGVGARHVWGDSLWWTDHAVVISALVGAIAAAMFADRLLELPATHPWLARGVRGVAVVSALALVALVAGVLPLDVGQRAGGVLVLLPVLLAMKVAWRRWRGGDAAAFYMLVGWTAFAVGIVPLVLMVRGLVDAGFWTQNGALVGRTLGMLAWLRVLGLRIDEIRRRAERAEHAHRELHLLAHADALTGLPNRRALDASLQSALQDAAPGALVAVFVGDLDGFKGVNDRLGHEAGDELLVAAARRLRSRVRRGDLVARLGGDEFVVVATGLSSEDDARQVGRQLVDAFDEPFALGGEGVRVGLTLGCAIAPGDGRDGADLLRHADEAMYAGKRAGKARLARASVPAG